MIYVDVAVVADRAGFALIPPVLALRSRGDFCLGRSRISSVACRR
jgi:hypothetical protein